MSNFNQMVGQQQPQRNKPGLMTGPVISNNTPAPNPLSAPTMLPVNSNYPLPAHPMVGSHPHKQILTNPNNQVTVNQTGANQATPGKVIVQNGEVSPELQNGVQENGEEKENTLNTEESLANTKEKTPMCLINELARYNKITHQYTLIDEQGPAHKKTFYVQLKLGEKEEYSASGASIKKAQHAAADVALTKTTYGHPPVKPAKPNPRRESVSTPTVELNALLMKRGEQAMYKPLDTRAPNYYPAQNYNYRGMYNHRYHHPRVRKTIYVSLKVGAREFIGEGNSRQDARHDAAGKALTFLSKLPLPAEDQKPSETAPAEKLDEDDPDGLKSEISLVHEIALKRNLNVIFDVTRESGPPHMKIFVTRCKVGEFQTEAEGQSKKTSKKKAADLMLEKLRELPCLPPTLQRLKTKPNNKKKAKNIIKQMQKANPDYGVGINPISRLIQIQQAQQKKEPVYTLVTERGLPRRREFVIQVAVDDQVCTGVGPNKKLAKRHAAEAMLTLLGYNKPSPQPAKPAIKSNGGSTPETPTGEKKVTFVDNSEEPASDNLSNGKGVNRQRQVPGLIRLPEAGYAGGSPIYTQNANMNPMGDSMSFGNSPQSRLRDITSRNKVNIKFDEFAGTSNTSEVLSRVTFVMNPPRTFHGSGPTVEAARDNASMEGLKFLAEFGKEESKKAASGGGDGPHVKVEPTGDGANSVGRGAAHTGRVAPM